MFHCGNCILKINLSNQKSWISWISWNFFCKLIFCNQIMKEIIYFLVTRYFGHFKMGEGGNLTEIYFYLDNYVYQKYIVYDLDSILCDRSCCILALLYIITYTFLLRLIILFLLSAFALVFYIFIKCHSLTYCWEGFFFVFHYAQIFHCLCIKMGRYNVCLLMVFRRFASHHFIWVSF